MGKGKDTSTSTAEDTSTEGRRTRSLGEIRIGIREEDDGAVSIGLLGDVGPFERISDAEKWIRENAADGSTYTVIRDVKSFTYRTRTVTELVET